MTVAVLCTRRRSVYLAFPGVECYGEDRDCRSYGGPWPVVAHPPCRGWGRLRTFARVAPGELELAPFCLTQARTWGGVLEHPAGSRLWREFGMPIPGVDKSVDSFGGFSVSVCQGDWGHRALKWTWLYVVGMDLDRLPSMPIARRDAVGQVQLMHRGEREGTPVRFAMWLVEVARRCTWPSSS